MKKFELIKSDIDGLFRIKALQAFSNVKEGAIGGYVEKEENLSQEGNAWIYDNAVVRDNAQIYGDAHVCNNALVRDNAQVFGDARVYDIAVIRDNACACDNAQIYGGARVCGNSEVFGDAWIYGNAQIHDDVQIFRNAKVFGNVLVHGDARIQGNARVRDDADYIVFKNWWSSGRYFTWTRSNNMWTVGCFYGTGEELIKKAYADNEKSGKEYERVVRYVESILENN